MSHLILLCFSLRLCITKFYFVLKKFVEYNEISFCSKKDFSVCKILLCSQKYCCVLEKIVVVFSKSLLCS